MVDFEMGENTPKYGKCLRVNYDFGDFTEPYARNCMPIECDGLKWGASKLVPLAYGIKKLQIISVVEDKVSIDWLQEGRAGCWRMRANVMRTNATDNSYIEVFQPSQADTTVFQALKSPPSAEFPHALRWYNHFKSFGNGITSFPGVKKDISAFTVASKSESAKPSKGVGGDDDDDLDLFGSDDESDEAEKMKQQRLRQYAEKKSKKPGVIAKSSVVLDVKPWDD
ncbi:elongation factor 1-beta [Trichonephila clavipes]|nr:elongation factor 1-beta [Trichonephila clavipes]